MYLLCDHSESNKKNEKTDPKPCNQGNEINKNIQETTNR